MPRGAELFKFRAPRVVHIYNIMIADFHNDFLTEGAGALRDFSRKTDAMVCALYRGGRGTEEIGALLQKFGSERAANQFLGLEDAGYCFAFGIQKLARHRPVYASLTWNYENELAGGCLEDTGLKQKGAAAVRALTECGVTIDCAHLGQKAFRRVVDLTDDIADSHTCAAAVHAHPRNLEDWQIGEIVARGGLVGIAFVGAFLSDAPCAEDVFRHIDHCVQKFGGDGFCIGTDFYGTNDLPRGAADYSEAESLRSFFSRAGYDEKTIDKIFFVNLKKFLDKKRHIVP